MNSFKKIRIKKLLKIVVPFTFLTGLYIALTPIITLYNLKIAFDTNDSKKLSRSIDFPLLRENLAKEIQKDLTIRYNNTVENDRIKAIGSLIFKPVVTAASNKIVDTLVTEEGLERLIKEGAFKKEDPQANSPSLSSSKQAKNGMKDITMGYTSLNEFKLTNRISDNKIVHVRFRRDKIINWLIFSIEVKKNK